MSEKFESEHSDIVENNAPPGLLLKLIILAIAALSIWSLIADWSTDSVSADTPKPAASQPVSK